jgi:hypothetical protein
MITYFQTTPLPHVDPRRPQIKHAHQLTYQLKLTPCPDGLHIPTGFPRFTGTRPPHISWPHTTHQVHHIPPSQSRRAVSSIARGTSSMIDGEGKYGCTEIMIKSTAKQTCKRLDSRKITKRNEIYMENKTGYFNVDSTHGFQQFALSEKKNSQVLLEEY